MRQAIAKDAASEQGVARKQKRDERKRKKDEEYMQKVEEFKATRKERYKDDT